MGKGTQPGVMTDGVGFDAEEVGDKLATYCKNRSITSNPDWNTHVEERFNATNASGLSPQTRTLLEVVLKAAITIKRPGETLK